MPVAELKPREARESVFLSAAVTCFGTAEPTRHRVRNLSDHGACIDQAGMLRPGQTVLVDIGEIEELGATVQWVAADLAGLKFAHLIRRTAAKWRPKPPHIQQGWTALPRR